MPRRWIGAPIAAALVAVAVGVPAAPAAAAAVQLRFVTANVDFGLPQSQVKADWQTVIAPNADIVFLQEAKAVTLTDFVDTTTWLVLQDTSSDDRAGSALVIRRSVFADRENYDLVKGVDGGSCPGGGIETRWIAKIALKLHNGRWLRVASLHLPPDRCQTGPGSLYDRMSDNVVDFVRTSDRLTVLGADWNKVVDDDPNDIGARANLEPNGPDDGLRIDGFMYSRSIANCCLTRLAATHSDHRPIQLKLTVPA
jgi:endonuclease/exonuclease/phosphatase family metal-dependent hydrolase